MSHDWTIPGILVGGICVLAIYSFLYKENPFYRFFEHVYIGIATAYWSVWYIKAFIWPDFLRKSLGIDVMLDTPWKTFDARELLMFIPFIFGCGILFMLSRKHNWIARIVIGAGLGMAGGLAFKGTFADMFPRLVNSFRPLAAFYPQSGGWDVRTTLENFLFLVTLVCVMTYFFFSFEHDKPFIKQASITGRYLMMVTFGAFFGATVMARMALLIDRLQFLTQDWPRGAAEFWTLMFGG
ncbi:MAG: hypothetical protein ACYTGB_05060 [Planctomycetota bacterium]|jgi:hypothetical protein